MGGTMKIDDTTGKHTIMGHGWELVGRGVMLGVGNLPGRKQACLYVQRVRDGSCTMYPLAYFVDGASALEALAILDSIAGGDA